MGSAQTLSPTVMKPAQVAVTRPLREIHDDPANSPRVHFHQQLPKQRTPSVQLPDSVLQVAPGPLINATGGTHFDAVGAGGFAPSDDNMAVGRNPSFNYILQTVNSRYAVFTKSGGLILGPNSLSSLWAPLGRSNGCATNNAGDVVAQYDAFADRWLITQLGGVSGPFSECIAVSQTPDPTGAYFLYSYDYGTTLNDYPKFGVWPTATNSAYTASYNLFANGSSFVGGQLCAYDRTKMLVGDPSAAAVCFPINGDGGYLPADVDGANAPLNGTPAYFLNYNSLSSLRMYTLAPNFVTPNASVLTQVQPTISVAAFTEPCSGASVSCIPQTGTTQPLDSLGDRLMYRAAFRNFGDHEALVVNHSVVAGASVGVRWYELRAPVATNGTFTLYQQGTFAPDAAYRWMGSAAMDGTGNIAVGYSVSSSSIHPGVRYTGRTPADPLGTMETEASILEGTGSQNGNLDRWGDYTALRIDPADDCTFWYTNQYLKADGSYNWSTVIGSFKFGTCGGTTTTNLALGKAATQSSTLTGYGPAGASNGVDGNNDGNFFHGSVTHTNLDANAWWQVDLGAPATVASVTIWNRTDCCSNRLSDYWVFVSNTPFLATDTPTTLQGRAGTFSSHQTSFPNPASTIAVNAQGRYVRVQLSGSNYLSLAEVQVFGTSSGVNTFGISGQVTLSAAGLNGVTMTLTGSQTGSVATSGNGNYSFTGLAAGGTYTVTPSLTGYTFTPPSQVFSNLSADQTANFTATAVTSNSNLAVGKTATQSSTLTGFGPAGASNAVDGNTDGNFFHGSVSHTNLDANAWWQVDLGAAATVSSITIWNRTDCCGNRLSDYWVFVSNTPFLATDTPTTLQGRAGTFSSHQTTFPNPSTAIAVNAAGRYVRVQLSGSNYLSLAEVQVFGTTSGTTFGISGQVTLLGAGFNGVTMTLSGSQSGSVVTSGSGNYSFTGLAAGGTYTVTPSLSGYSFTPPSQTFTNLSANQTANFTASGNVAVGKAATQSSTLSGFGTTTVASSAVDGNTDGNFFHGSVSHTNLETNAWWQVDLGASVTVSSVTVWNRTDCCSDRLTDYWLFVSNTPFLATDTPTTLQGRAGTFSSHQTTFPNPSATIPVNAAGRYVRVQLSGSNYLSLAEVQVSGQ
jgi:hypothetical protein